MVLVDGNSLMHRAFHALPLLDDGAGVYTNAVFGFLSMLFRVLKEEQPQYLAVAFDLHGPTFRHRQYQDYKAGRAPTPPELKPQFPLLKELLQAMHIAQVSLEGYEADDMLGTLSARWEALGGQALLITGDRDAFQLAGPHTAILYTKRGITDTQLVTPDYLMQAYALSPGQMIDLKGLMGDTSDNIPGIPGVGEKTALKLLSQYGTLESALERGAAEQKGKLRERLVQYGDQARFSKALATICRDAPIQVDPEALRLHGLAGGRPALERYKLKSLSQRLAQLPGWMLGEAGDCPSGDSGQPGPEKGPSPAGESAWRSPAALAGAQDAAAWALAQDPGQAVALALGEASCALSGGAQGLIPLGGGDLLSPGLTPQDVCRALAPLLAGPGEKLVWSVKDLMTQMPPEAALGGDVYDAMLAAYALNPQRRSYSLPSLLEEAGLAPAEGETQAAKLFPLREAQLGQLDREGLSSLYRDIELPLAYTLRDMERQGFLVDREVLRQLGGQYAQRIQQDREQICQLAGEEFNLNSPKQLGEVLFGKLGLPGGKKTSKGWSTTADILEELADRHPIVPLVLDYRKYFKLNSTYVEALLRLMGPDGRVHTQFDQTATATGRISSNEPNLQNIPVRTPEGRQIRRAFVAAPGHVLVDADYSQIELRVLAHMSQDQTLCDAFLQGQDIHRRTAAEVYGVPIGQVTGEMRSAAKAVNFGIIYGISDFGLARSIGCSRKEAAGFIQRYFARYPGVKAFMEGQVALAKAQGYVTTLFGRRRYIPELQSPNYNVRSFGQRAAMNSPIQGTAADIIKLAMIRTRRALKEAHLQARLILQVHDELIVEAPEAEKEAVAQLLRQSMEGAAQLRAPLKADLAMGRDWHECKA